MNLEPRRLSENEGKIPCPMSFSSCEAAAWDPLEDADLASQLDHTTTRKIALALRYRLFDAAAARRKLEADIAAREEMARAAKLAFEDKVRQHRLVIVERDLITRCPRCGVEQDADLEDPHMCTALFCGSCGCGYCGLCLFDCGRDAHQHIRDVHGGGPGSTAPFEKAAFDEARTDRAQSKLIAAIRGLASEGTKLQRAVGGDGQGGFAGPRHRPCRHLRRRGRRRLIGGRDCRQERHMEFGLAD